MRGGTFSGELSCRRGWLGLTAGTCSLRINGAVWSRCYSTPWYLQTYSSLLPMAGVPEKEMKTILSKAQWDRWAGEDLGNAMNYWDSIENNHKNRVQQKR